MSIPFPRIRSHEHASPRSTEGRAYAINSAINRTINNENCNSASLPFLARVAEAGSFVRIRVYSDSHVSHSPGATEFFLSLFITLWGHRHGFVC